MTVAQYIVSTLVSKGITDVFGIPGGVILDLLYAFDRLSHAIVPHLMCHEQNAGFAACGYAQSTGKIGVAYFTKGPGFTNVITPIAEAYYESIPTLFITGHSSNIVEGIRTMNDQEMDTCHMVEKITKFSKRLDNIETFSVEFQKAIELCVSGRKGPVFLDIADNLWNKEIIFRNKISINNDSQKISNVNYNEIAQLIYDSIHPVILFGDGVVQSYANKEFWDFVNRIQIPVISSRATHYLIAKSEYYFGYIGSHGIRCANFILSKADLIIAIGNRMHYPISSSTFSKALTNTKILRFDIDDSEFKRDIPNSNSYCVNAKDLLLNLLDDSFDFGKHIEWYEICKSIRTQLHDTDIVSPIPELASLLQYIPTDSIIISDVGNHEFLLSRTSVWINDEHHILYSKSFGALGNAIGKSIGAYYATRKLIICVIGDQGVQMNSQELQYIGTHHLPIIIVVMNNERSGMIYDREVGRFDKVVHTTLDSGYSVPNFETWATAFGFNYTKSLVDLDYQTPTLFEIKYTNEYLPSIPKGNECQNMYPYLSEYLYDKLSNL